MKKINHNTSRIKELSEDDRPREKLQNQGKQYLSNVVFGVLLQQI